MGERRQTATRGVSARQSVTFHKLSSIPLPVPTGTYESPAPLPGDVAYLSPNGKLFALTLSAANGTARIGTVDPFRTRTVHLGRAVRVVGLTDKYLICANADSGQAYVFPVSDRAKLGIPLLWSWPPDLWQNWLSTSKGLAIETGGYQAGTLSLTIQNGQRIPLHGGEIYLSSDRRWGVVLTRPRMRWSASPADFYELQPAGWSSPVAIWHLSASGGPARTALLRFPEPPAGLNKGQLITQGIAISLNDRYVAIQLSELTGTRLTGVTYVYSVHGQLVGTLPYGNGFQWLPSSDGILLNTSDPRGKGHDRIISLQGRIVASWPDAMAETILPLSETSMLAMRNEVIGRVQQGKFRALAGLPKTVQVDWARWLPHGQAAIIELGGSTTESIWLATLTR